MTSPFVVVGAPPELQARIDASRRFWAGLSMSLGATEGGEQAPAPVAGQTPTGQAAPTPPPGPLTPRPKGVEEPPVEDAETARLRKEVEDLRRENAEKRVRARDADKEAQAKIAGALKSLQEAGLLPEGIKLDDADPVRVAEQAAEESRRAADETRSALVLSKAENVVWRASRELGLNAAAINDSRAFSDAIKTLDPEADDFAAQVTKAAQEAAAINPALRAAPGGGRGGSGFSGGPGEQSLKARVYGSLAESVAADYRQ